MSKLFILSAPSGTGKTTLVNELIKFFHAKYALERVITYTSKQPRPSEIEGKDYFFVSEEEFKAHIEKGFFLEWSTAYGAYYGLPKSILTKVAQGIPCIAVVDRNGARALQAESNSIGIWLIPPSLEELKSRLYSRAQDSLEVIKFRLSLAKQELKEEEQEKLFEYTVINDSFEVALERLKEIIEQELGPLKKE